MTLKLPRLVVGLAMSLMAACGAPGAFDICNAHCDALKRCNFQTDAQTTNCHTSCANNQGLLSDEDNQLAKQCKNAGDIRKTQLNCYTNANCQSSLLTFEAATGDCVSTAQSTKNCVTP
jgi:hypothetical protein